MNCVHLILLIALLQLPSCILAAPGGEVIVVYNSSQPESEALANFYARKREIPSRQVIGLPLPESETISRAAFRDRLQRPLAKQLEDLELWRIGRGTLPGTNGTSIAARRKVVDSKIRYAVLCYGIPLKILPDPDVQEAEAENLRPELRRNEASVDSELSCLPLLAHGYPLAGPHLNPLYATTNATQLHPTNGILMVARLDGPTSAIARGLVDKALEAEANGLWGRAYFDARNIADPGYKVGDDWIRTAAKIAEQMGFDTELDENADTFPASYPMSQIAIYMGWYRGDVSGPFARTNVEFMPGAFAYHLHSFSAPTLRTATAHWVGPLLARGATCSMGTVNEPFLTGTPDLAIFASRWMLLGLTFGEAAYAAQSTLSWQTTVVGDPLYRPFGASFQEQHQALLAQTNQLAEWSLARLINLNRIRGMGLMELTTALEEAPITRQSAVLTEKLADLYAAQGKPASAIFTYERALELSPSPQQQLRLRLTLAEKLTVAARTKEARDQYEAILAERPNYPNEPLIRQKIAALTPRIEVPSPNGVSQ